MFWHQFLLFFSFVFLSVHMWGCWIHDSCASLNWFLVLFLLGWEPICTSKLKILANFPLKVNFSPFKGVFWNLDNCWTVQTVSLPPLQFFKLLTPVFLFSFLHCLNPRDGLSFSFILCLCFFLNSISQTMMIGQFSLYPIKKNHTSWVFHHFDFACIDFVHSTSRFLRITLF